MYRGESGYNSRKRLVIHLFRARADVCRIIRHSASFRYKEESGICRCVFGVIQPLCVNEEPR